jgi:hypothetical protein
MRSVRFDCRKASSECNERHCGDAGRRGVRWLLYFGYSATMAGQS